MSQQSPRSKAEEITAKKREPENLDTENLAIWEATLKSLENTKPAFRDRNWQRKFDKVKKEIARLSKETKKDQ